MFFWRKKKEPVNPNQELINKLNIKSEEFIQKCKCCGGEATYFNFVDFSKNCEEHKGLLLPKTKIKIHYHQCKNCGFLFTTAFDTFSEEDFAKYIYNEDYVKVDPDFTGLRAENNSKWIPKIFTESEKNSFDMLDYGGGEGKLSKYLKKDGISMDTYDPYSEHNIKPEKKYDVIFSFEVAEHTPNPKETFKDMLSLLKEDGVILFSTCPVPENIAKQGLNWWYVAPRNGHISFYTGKSLANIFIPEGYNIAPVGEILFMVVPENKENDFVKRIFKR